MEATVEVLSSSLVPLEDSSNTVQPSILKIHARTDVSAAAANATPFSSITLTLYGAVRSTIASRSAVEKVLEITKERQWTDFETCSKTSNHFVDVCFSILPRPGAVDPTCSQSFIPSLTINGEAAVTTSDVLSSHKLVKGKCEVIYWIEADFYRGRRGIHRMKVPIQISKAAAPMQMEITAKSKEPTLSVPVKPLIIPMIKRGWPFRQRKRLTPKISVQLPKDLGHVYSATTKSETAYQLVEIPLTFHMEQPSPFDPCCTDFLGNFLPQASVEARWYTTKTFSTADLSGHNPDMNTIHAPRIVKKSVVKQKQLLNFPPFYQRKACQTLAGEDNSKFSATAMMTLLLPETVRCPTVNTGLLKVSYELELRISLEDNSKEGIVPCAAKLRVPLFIEST